MAFDGPFRFSSTLAANQPFHTTRASGEPAPWRKVAASTVAWAMCR
jgi:hypothetical protein